MRCRCRTANINTGCNKLLLQFTYTLLCLMRMDLYGHSCPIVVFFAASAGEGESRGVCYNVQSNHSMTLNPTLKIITFLPLSGWQE